MGRRAPVLCPVLSLTSGVRLLLPPGEKMQTAIKVVNKRQAAGSAPRQQQLVQQQEQQPKRAGEEADPTRRLEFDQVGAKVHVWPLALLQNRQCLGAPGTLVVCGPS